MTPRGTRRPHMRRVRSKPVRMGRGGGGKKNNGCALLLFFVLALPALVWAVAR